jgi:hypothetical protein
MHKMLHLSSLDREPYKLAQSQDWVSIFEATWLNAG